MLTLNDARHERCLITEPDGERDGFARYYELILRLQNLWHGTCSADVGRGHANLLFVEPGAFDPEAIAAMGEALEAALEELQGTGEPEVMRERIATKIIAAAKLGERDRARLLEAALTTPRGQRD